MPEIQSGEIPNKLSQKRPLYKRPLGCLLFAVLLVAIAAGSLVITAGMVLFDHEPDFALEPMNRQDRMLQQRLAKKLVPEILRGEPAEATIHFSPGEINSLIRIADNGFTLQSLLMGGTPGSVPKKHHKLEYRDGEFDMLLPLDTEHRWFFGWVLIMKFKTKPEKDEDDLKLRLTDFRIGRFDMPDDYTSLLEEELLGIVRRHRDYQRFSKALKSAKFDDEGNLIVVYRPKELRNAIFAR